MEIEMLLSTRGPLLSSELIRILMQENKINGATARKRLSRAKLPVTKTKGYFSDNQVMYHLQEQYKKPDFYETLVKAFQTDGKKYYSIIKAIEFHFGYLRKTEIPSYSFSPIHNLKGHKRFDDLIKEFEELGVIISHQDIYFRLNPHISQIDNFRHHKAVETGKNFVLSQFYEWARNIGLVSYSKGEFQAQFGKLQWAYVAPSYIASLTKYKDEKIIPCFVIGDILIGNRIDDSAINFFLQKIEILKQLKRLPNFIPFLIVDGLQLETLKALKSKGIIIAFVDQLFGREYKELLSSLINTVTNAGAILKNNPDAYLDLINKIQKLVDGKTNNLRGDIFELAVGFFHSYYCKNIDIGKLISYGETQREIDVFALYPDKVVISECKGYKTKINKSVLEKWISDKIFIIRNWILEQNYLANKKIVFEFWSSGGFDDEAIKFIKSKTIKQSNKYHLEFIDEEKMIDKTKEINSRKINEILKNYFVKEI